MKTLNGGLVFLKQAKGHESAPKPVVNKCNTCDAKFSNVTDLKSHYKSDWHIYNVKRKSGDLNILSHPEFMALRMRMEDALKVQNLEISEHNERHLHHKSPPSHRISSEKRLFKPRKSLFDDHVSNSIVDNVRYMEKQHSFYLPEKQYIVNLTGLLGHLHKTIYEYNMCLYCDKIFDDWHSVLYHMDAKGHKRLNDDHFQAISDYYDFRDSPIYSCGFIETLDTNFESGDDDGEWEDVQDCNSNSSSAHSCNGYNSTPKMAIQIYNGAKILPNGNLKLPNGQEAVHREMSYIYKQNLRPLRPFSPRLRNGAGLVGARANTTFKLLPRADKRLISASQSRKINHEHRQRLAVALKSYKLFVPRRQDLCFG